MTGIENKAYDPDRVDEDPAKEDTKDYGREEAAQATPVKSFRNYKLAKQLLLVSIWICMGLAGEMPGPTLVDLRRRLGVNNEEISLALQAKGIGSIFGAIIGGFINERFYRHLDLSLSFSLFLIAGSAVVIPFSEVLGLTAAMFAVNGMAEGVINTGGNTMVMHLWGEDAASPLNSLHFGFGLGALVAPQIARPFLSPDALDDDDDKTTTFPSATTESTASQAPYVDQSSIEIPYAIAGIAIAIFSFILICFYIKGPPKGFKFREPESNFREMINPGSCSNGRTCFSIQLLVALMFYFVQAVGGERAYGKFLFSFAYETGTRTSDAANLQTAFWASFTAGRLSGVFFGKFVPLRYIMIFNVFGNIIASSVLAAYGQNEVIVLWVFSCIIGTLISIVFPNGMSWANLHLNMNSMAVMVLVIGAGCGDFAYNYLTGFLFEKDPQNLMYVMIGYSVALAVVFAVMEAMAFFNDKLYVENHVEPIHDVEIVDCSSIPEKVA